MRFSGWRAGAADRRFDEQLKRIVQGRPLDGLEPADAGERGELAAARMVAAELAPLRVAPAEARARVWGAVRARIEGEVEARRPGAGRSPRPAFGWSLCGVAAAAAVVAVLTAVAAWRSLLGHERIETTAVHSQPHPRDLERAVERLAVG